VSCSNTINKGAPCFPQAVDSDLDARKGNKSIVKDRDEQILGYLISGDNISAKETECYPDSFIIDNVAFSTRGVFRINSQPVFKIRACANTVGNRLVITRVNNQAYVHSAFNQQGQQFYPFYRPQRENCQFYDLSGNYITSQERQPAISRSNLCALPEVFEIRQSCLSDLGEFCIDGKSVLSSPNFLKADDTRKVIDNRGNVPCVLEAFDKNGFRLRSLKKTKDWPNAIADRDGHSLGHLISNSGVRKGELHRLPDYFVVSKYTPPPSMKFRIADGVVDFYNQQMSQQSLTDMRLIVANSEDQQGCLAFYDKDGFEYKSKRQDERADRAVYDSEGRFLGNIRRQGNISREESLRWKGHMVVKRFSLGKGRTLVSALDGQAILHFPIHLRGNFRLELANFDDRFECFSAFDRDGYQFHPDCMGGQRHENGAFDDQGQRFGRVSSNFILSRLNQRDRSDQIDVRRFRLNRYGNFQLYRSGPVITRISYASKGGIRIRIDNRKKIPFISSIVDEDGYSVFSISRSQTDHIYDQAGRFLRTLTAEKNSVIQEMSKLPVSFQVRKYHQSHSSAFWLNDITQFRVAAYNDCSDIRLQVINTVENQAVETAHDKDGHKLYSMGRGLGGSLYTLSGEYLDDLPVASQIRKQDLTQGKTPVEVRGFVLQALGAAKSGNKSLLQYRSYANATDIRLVIDGRDKLLRCNAAFDKDGYQFHHDPINEMVCDNDAFDNQGCRVGRVSSHYMLSSKIDGTWPDQLDIRRFRANNFGIFHLYKGGPQITRGWYVNVTDMRIWIDNSARLPAITRLFDKDGYSVFSRLLAHPQAAMNLVYDQTGKYLGPLMARQKILPYELKNLPGYFQVRKYFQGDSTAFLVNGESKFHLSDYNNNADIRLQVINNVVTQAVESAHDKDGYRFYAMDRGMGGALYTLADEYVGDLPKTGNIRVQDLSSRMTAVQVRRFSTQREGLIKSGQKTLYKNRLYANSTDIRLFIVSQEKTIYIHKAFDKDGHYIHGLVSDTDASASNAVFNRESLLIGHLSKHRRVTDAELSLFPRQFHIRNHRQLGEYKFVVGNKVNTIWSKYCYSDDLRIEITGTTITAVFDKDGYHFRDAHRTKGPPDRNAVFNRQDKSIGFLSNDHRVSESELSLFPEQFHIKRYSQFGAYRFYVGSDIKVSWAEYCHSHDMRIDIDHTGDPNKRVVAFDKNGHRFYPRKKPNQNQRC
jgi:hypothetical protein